MNSAAAWSSPVQEKYLVLLHINIKEGPPKGSGRHWLRLLALELATVLIRLFQRYSTSTLYKSQRPADIITVHWYFLKFHQLSVFSETLLASALRHDAVCLFAHDRSRWAGIDAFSHL